MNYFFFNQTSRILDQIEFFVFYFLLSAVDAIRPSNYLLLFTVRDSSLSITEKLSSIVIPATTITRLSMREQREIESGRLEGETFEVRIVKG